MLQEMTDEDILSLTAKLKETCQRPQEEQPFWSVKPVTFRCGRVLLRPCTSNADTSACPQMLIIVRLVCRVSPQEHLLPNQHHMHSSVTPATCEVHGLLKRCQV